MTKTYMDSLGNKAEIRLSSVGSYWLTITDRRKGLITLERPYKTESGARAAMNRYSKGWYIDEENNRKAKL